MTACPCKLIRCMRYSDKYRIDPSKVDCKICALPVLICHIRLVADVTRSQVLVKWLYTESNVHVFCVLGKHWLIVLCIACPL